MHEDRECNDHTPETRAPHYRLHVTGLRVDRKRRSLRVGRHDIAALRWYAWSSMSLYLLSGWLGSNFWPCKYGGYLDLAFASGGTYLSSGPEPLPSSATGGVPT